MDEKMILEICGYIGSAMVVVSMLMTSIVKLRIINTVGSVISGVYAVICGAVPLGLMNACLIVINVVGLFKLFKTKKAYDLVEGLADGALVKFFLDYYESDIKRYFPHFDKLNSYGQTAYFICHEGVPAGVLLGEKKNNSFEINIEYTTPTYRDCSVGKYLYACAGEKGIKTFAFINNPSEEHEAYLKKMGYKKVNGIYTLSL